MIKRIPVLILLVVFTVDLQAQEVRLIPGMKISSSTLFKKAAYLLNAPGDSTPVILIEGKNIVIDFNNAEILGNENQSRPDSFSGIAILIRNSSNVTIRNLKASGFKVALMATNVDYLTIENCNFSYNYRQRLNSTQEKEDVSDWMSFHNNEKDEWLRYGAGIYLRDCDSVRVMGCTITGGQNALMMTGCDDGLVYNNDFSFNSGVGIGLYRSNRNKILHNRVIFNVRGYSHNVYHRGQDSAGILVYEQSSNNIFFKNNVTHGGDGFFLWAGQSTMETGKGGCNDNLIMENDFSYAPTNGIEVTFSRNKILNNRIFGCDHGIWGGYSYETLINFNSFRDNRIAIAIEHGQHNDITHNLFAGDKEAIRLWSRASQPSDWGYAKFRDTRSAGYAILLNSFNNHGLVFNLSRTDSINIFDNTISEGIVNRYKLDSSVGHLDTFFLQSVYDDVLERQESGPAVPEISGAMNPFKGSGVFAGRDKILMTEWGPYDYRYPIIWQKNPVEKSDTLRFEILGPSGEWSIKGFKGVHGLSRRKGTFPASLTAIREKGAITDIAIELEYKGQGFTTVFGKKVPKGRASAFRFRKYFQPINWEVLFYSMDTAYHNPVATGQLFSMLERKAPFRTDTADRLEYAWWGGIRQGGLHHRQFITVSTGRVNLPRGEYEISLTWDDALRLYIDDSLVVNEWNPSLYKFDESPNRKIRVHLNGNHQFRVEHLELGGFATLNLKLRPAE